MSHWTPVCLILTVLSCSKSKEDDKATSKPPTADSVGEIDDTSLEGIKTFLQADRYKNWKAETTVHDSTGPHGKVRSFFNPALVKSLKDGNAKHPQGSISVKELYESDGTTLKGYALEAKTDDGSGSDAWFWYEGTEPALDQYYGQGLSTCVNCHSSGADYVISSP